MSIINYKICCFYFDQNNGEKTGLSPILSIIQTVTIGKMVNFNVDNNRHGLKKLTRKQTFFEKYLSNLTGITGIASFLFIPPPIGESKWEH